MIGAIFFACAGAPETRKRALMWSGIASVVAVVAGMRMAFTIYHGMHGWIWVKVVCWIGLAGLVGVAYRRRAQARLWVWLTLILAALALVMVYVQPSF